MLTVVWDRRGTTHRQHTELRKSTQALGAKALKTLKPRINRVLREPKRMLLQHGNASLLTGAATSAAVQNVGFEGVVRCPCTI
jgi:hypothetical protein